MDGYQVTKIVGLRRAKGGQLVVVFENHQGDEKGLMLSAADGAALAVLLQQGLSELRPSGAGDPEPRGRIEADPGLTGEVRVSHIEIRSAVSPRSPASPGTFQLRLEGQSGAGVTLSMSHEEVVIWRDTLSKHIAAFTKRSN